MDIDGTLVLGDQLIDGTRELIEEIHRQHGICCYFTNNSSRGVAEYVDKFLKWGICDSWYFFNLCVKERIRDTQDICLWNPGISLGV